MYDLNQAIKFFILKKMHESEKWQKIKIVFTGSDTPGEGEHKIISYIRKIK